MHDWKRKKSRKQIIPKEESRTMSRKDQMCVGRVGGREKPREGFPQFSVAPDPFNLFIRCPAGGA